MGSNATITHIQEKSSACVEVLRTLAHQMTAWFGVRDHNRGHSEVSAAADIASLCLDLSIHHVHTLTPGRKIPPVRTRGRKSSRTTAVCDVLLDGMQMLTEKNLFHEWLARSGTGGTDIYSGDSEGDAGEDLGLGTVFQDPDGSMEVDTTLDPELDNEGHLDAPGFSAVEPED